jgi:glycosyltransferase involved in cell wall biosynthesis
MYIVYVVGHLQHVSGGLRVITEHVNRLAALGNRVEIWTPHPEEVLHFECEVPVLTYTESKLVLPDVVLATDPFFIPAILESGRKVGNFVMLQHDNEWVNKIVGLENKVWNISHFAEHFRDRRLKLIVVSSWLHDVIKSRYDIDSKVIRNGIDHEIFRPCQPLISTSDPTVLMLYDPQVWKGFLEGLEACLEVRKEIPNLRIMLFSRFYPKIPSEKGVQFGLPFPVIFFGRPQQEDLAAIYSSATVFLSASWEEGFGLAGLEALACGVPLVTTDSGGVREYAVSGETAIVVRPNHKESIEDGIKLVLTNKELRTKLKKNGLEKAASFDWGSSIKQLVELL